MAAVGAGVSVTYRDGLLSLVRVQRDAATTVVDGARGRIAIQSGVGMNLLVISKAAARPRGTSGLESPVVVPQIYEGGRQQVKKWSASEAATGGAVVPCRCRRSGWGRERSVVARGWFRLCHGPRVTLIG